MKRLPIVLAFLFISFQVFSQKKYAVRNVSVIPMNKEMILLNQTVLISSGRIEAMGNSTTIKIPDDYLIVDAPGKYLVPGLMDMHVHFFQEQYDDHKNTTATELKLMLANGLTFVRILAGHPDYLQARENVKNKQWTGPGLSIASPQLAGAWPWPPDFKNYEIVDTRQKSIEAVKRFKEQGYDEIKITFMVNRECYDAIVKTAKEVGIRVVGHVGPKVKLPAALAAKQQIEHMDEFIEMLLPDTTYNHGQSVSDMNLWRMSAWATVPFLDENKMVALVRMVKDAGIYVTPTNFFFVSCFGSAYTDEVYKQRPDYQFISSKLIAERWSIKERQRKMPIPSASLEKYVYLRKKMVLELWKQGVPLMAGSDSPEWFLVPGFALHDELDMFVSAGLTPYAALQTATINPAVYLGLKNKGTIEKGKDADIILLDKNPLDDIKHTRAINSVFKAGELYTRELLNNMLTEAKALGN